MKQPRGTKKRVVGGMILCNTREFIKVTGCKKGQECRLTREKEQAIETQTAAMKWAGGKDQGQSKGLGG